jgi:hypothetical protein
MPYRVGPFTDVNPLWGARLWEFLNRKYVVQKMVVASDDSRPAAEVIALDLHQAFGDDIREDRVKQFSGFLILQVMSANGFELKSYGHKTAANTVFTEGATYNRRK